jgi:AraC-like DNA-binding protein
VAAAYLRDRHAVAVFEGRSLRDLVVRDELAAQLSRSLTLAPNGGDPFYLESVGQTVLMRALAPRPAPPRVGGLPRWRLRRVQEYLAANLSEPISLADLAGVAGLSRMHFAAQFRVATGCRPHDFLLQHRIESAKRILAEKNTPLVEVALSVGFQTQSHFSTVFKRLVGESPARWQRARRAG